MNCADGAHAALVYWKTRTSHGFRDAWTIAVFDHYVLGIWVGNFDGWANPGFVGRTAAAPLLFQIIDSLRATWPEPPVPHQPPPEANLKQVEFCALSGDLPNQFCTQRVEGWFIPGVSPINTCDVHREVLVDIGTGRRVPIDDGTHQVKREIYEFWPSEFLTLFEQAGIPRRVPPPFLADTGSEMASRTGRRPAIVSPGDNEIVLTSAKTIPLRAKADADVQQIFGLPASNSLARLHRTRFWSGTHMPVITTLPHSTITAAQASTTLLCDKIVGGGAQPLNPKPPRAASQ